MSRSLAEQLSLYLDDQLRPEERAALERQLARSPELERRLAELREVVQRVRALERAEPPEALARNLRRQLALEPELRGLRARLEARRGRYVSFDWRLLLAILATILALAVAGVFVANRSNPSPTTVIYVPAGADPELRADQLELVDGWLVAPGAEAPAGRAVPLDSVEGRRIAARYPWLPGHIAATGARGVRLRERGEVLELVATAPP